MNPFRIEGPAAICFSGGRTSGFMLHEILQAYGGELPPDVIATFSNTGKERAETLAFVQACGERWNVPIVWLEWRAPHTHEVVSHNAAARNGEPFEALITMRGKLPNPLMRFCSRDLKVEPVRTYCLHDLGWKHWVNVLGLRHDEGARLLRKYAENDAGGHRWRSAMPLDKAGVTRQDVMAFWAAQPFDLALRPYESNCDLCFLKSEGVLRTTMREQPGAAAWWIGQEAGGRRFERSRTYAGLARQVAEQPSLFGDRPDPSEEFDAECGVSCISA